MRGRGLMLVAGMRAGERRAEAQYQQQAASQQAQQQAYQEGQKAAQAQQTAAPPAAPAAAAPQKDTTAELIKLADLHKAGVLTDQEFEAAKKKLLT